MKLAIPLVALASFACGGHEASVAAPPNASQSEVVITKEQVTQMKIATDKVDLQNTDDTVLLAGKVAFDDSKVLHVFSPVTGKATSVNAQLGSHVKKRDILVTIESPDIGRATSDVGKALAALKAAEVDLERQKELRRLNANSQKDLENAENTYRNAKAELERAQQLAGLLGRGDIVGNTYTLRAGLDGEVFFKNVSTGAEVSGQYGGTNPQEIFTIGDADQVWVLSDLYEADLARVKLGYKVTVNVPAYKDLERCKAAGFEHDCDFEGTVDWISSALDPTTHAAKVRSIFDNTKRKLRLMPEMFGTVKIFVEPKRTLAIPRSAVIRLGDALVVFVDRGATPDGKERFERVPVNVDEGEGSQWLVISHDELKVGDVVVTNGALLLSDMLAGVPPQAGSGCECKGSAAATGSGAK
jgi:cobalt-zinc-cadmium efflux system membrane fusion protein